MGSGGARVGIWLQADTTTANKVEKKILKKLKKVNCFPGVLSEFKMFVAKMMGFDPNHEAIASVYKLIVGKTENYFQIKSTSQTTKRKSKKRLTKVEKSLKSILEGMGICLKIPVSIDSAKAMGGQRAPALPPPPRQPPPPPRQPPPPPPYRARSGGNGGGKREQRASAQFDKKWCERERKRILKIAKLRVGLYDREPGATAAIRKLRKDEAKTRKRELKRMMKKNAKKKTHTVIDISGMEEDDSVCIIDPPNFVEMTRRFEVIDITEQDDDAGILHVQANASNFVLTEPNDKFSPQS